MPRFTARINGASVSWNGLSLIAACTGAELPAAPGPALSQSIITAQQRPRRARLFRNAVPGLISSGCVTPSARPAPAAAARGSRSPGLNMHEAGAVGEPPS